VGAARAVSAAEKIRGFLSRTGAEAAKFPENSEILLAMYCEFGKEKRAAIPRSV